MLMDYFLYRTYWIVDNIVLCQELEDFAVLKNGKLFSTLDYPMENVLKETKFMKWYDQDPETVFPKILSLARRKGKKVLSLKEISDDETAEWIRNTDFCGEFQSY